MSKIVKRIALLLAMFIVIVFAVFVFNQTVQIVQSARTLTVVFGEGVMWALIFTYCLLLIAPLVLWFRLPKRMLPPAIAEGTEYVRFLADFKKRLSRNPRLRGMPLNSAIDTDAALQILDKQADDAVASAASTGSTVAAIPGMHLLASSVLSGSANAFLTLRVGMITKEYCRCTVRVEKMGLRRAATLKAAKLLGSIVRDGTVKLSKAAVNATVTATTTKLTAAFNRVARRRRTVEASCENTNQ